MAGKVALAKRAERERQELLDRLDIIAQALERIESLIAENGAAKPAPAKRANRQKRTGQNA